MDVPNDAATLARQRIGRDLRQAEGRVRTMFGTSRERLLGPMINVSVLACGPVGKRVVELATAPIGRQLSPLAVVALGGMSGGILFTLLAVPSVFHRLGSGRQGFVAQSVEMLGERSRAPQSCIRAQRRVPASGTCPVSGRASFFVDPRFRLAGLAEIEVPGRRRREGLAKGCHGVLPGPLPDECAHGDHREGNPPTPMAIGSASPS